MDIDTNEKIVRILEKLPVGGNTKFAAMTYEQGIEEVLLYLLGDITDDEFEYSIKNESVEQGRDGGIK